MNRATRRWARWRDGVRDKPALDLLYRMMVAVIGLVVLGAGIIAIPYPGPGWAIVFLGLAILASEFSWARKLLRAVRDRYDRFMAWFSPQPQWLRGIGVLFTAALVVATLWVLGALGWIAALLGIQTPWLKSPLGIGG
ncbi:hypothetical protein MYCSP_13060 [Mycobacteroides saopaulense]|uniref:TIGR02611 family protein n=1 Tax=Mycobacteroides saopaulense TaxID=1578165 RepID=UPI00072173A5|nr:TIGR02611 family protein [Mycobacteroides saopaulense]ALR12193.1 hypothetical protein MYCSP_13060 [Mycobacteroides saopaulense]